jgi:transposase-like protein
MMLSAGQMNDEKGADILVPLLPPARELIADRAQPFRSRLRETLRGRTAALEALAVEMDARGLSTRDIEALFADETGTSLLSRSAVSQICERLCAE